MPLILSMDASGPGPLPAASLDTTRSTVISSAISSISSAATLAPNTGSSSSGLPFFCCWRATRFRKPSSRLELPTRAMPVRSWPSRYLA
ncbi:hypothetical protein D9M68_816130 [compost metagenome]